MKKGLKLAVVMMMLCLLAACGSEPVTNSDDGAFTDYQRGFMSGWGNIMLEIPDGYYVLKGNLIYNSYLGFMDKEMKNFSFVCDKPECLHDQENMENKNQCNAYFPKTNAVNYYNGKIYITADASQKAGEIKEVVYEVEADGSNRKVFYSGEGEIPSFCIHKGNMILYEKKYKEDNAKPFISVIKFPMNNQKKKEILYETNEYKDVSVNNLECYKNYCYFSVNNWDEESGDSHCMIVNLDTDEKKDCSDFANSTLIVGKDNLYCRNIIERDTEKQTWKSEYYECSLDGEMKKKLTEKDFDILQKEVMMLRADEKYVYFSDVNYGGNAPEKEEQKFYIYTYDGKLAGTISSKNFSETVILLQGNEDYLFLVDTTDDGVIYYRVDKKKLGDGKEVVPEEIVRME